ncbi:hypothetical protein K438DRAFT_2019139, partial [Mycena galopus ATCC 62051]
MKITLGAVHPQTARLRGRTRWPPLNLKVKFEPLPRISTTRMFFCFTRPNAMAPRSTSPFPPPRQTPGRIVLQYIDARRPPCRPHAPFWERSPPRHLHCSPPRCLGMAARLVQAHGT